MWTLRPGRRTRTRNPLNTPLPNLLSAPIGTRTQGTETEDGASRSDGIMSAVPRSQRRRSAANPLSPALEGGVQLLWAVPPAPEEDSQVCPVDRAIKIDVSKHGNSAQSPEAEYHCDVRSVDRCVPVEVGDALAHVEDAVAIDVGQRAVRDLLVVRESIGVAVECVDDDEDRVGVVMAARLRMGSNVSGDRGGEQHLGRAACFESDAAVALRLPEQLASGHEGTRGHRRRWKS